MPLEHADLGVLHHVDRLAVHETSPCRWRSPRRSRPARRSGGCRSRTGPACCTGRICPENSISFAPSARPAPFAPRARRRRSRSAARSRPRRGSPAAPGRTGSGTGRTRRRSCTSSSATIRPCGPRWLISTTRSTISIGGPGQRREPVRPADPRPACRWRTRAARPWRTMRPLQELGVCHEGLRDVDEQPAPREPRADDDQRDLARGGSVVPVLREHAGRAGGAAVAELVHVEQVARGGDLRPLAHRVEHQQVRLVADEHQLRPVAAQVRRQLVRASPPTCGWRSPGPPSLPA